MSIIRDSSYPWMQGASALDFSGLDALRQGLHNPTRTEDAQKRVAHAFEALLIQQWLRLARQSGTLGAALHSTQLELANSLHDEQISLQLSDPGLGLAQALLTQIQRAGRTGEDALNNPSAPAPAALKVPAVRSSSVSDRVMSAIRDAPKHVSEFISRVSDAARRASRDSGVSEKLMLSQAALESGWGRREIKDVDGSNSYNLFGIKADGGWAGKSVSIVTTEYVNGRAHKMVQRFRAYDSYADSFTDYARLISKSPRYKKVMDSPSAELAARQLQDAGYATDPAYAQKLISIMGYFVGDQAQVKG